MLLILATLAAGQPVRVTGCGDSGPGASPGVPLRGAEITAPAAQARQMLAFARAQRAPYLPGRTALTPGPPGESVLTVQFGAPGPLGLIQDH